MDFTQVEWRGGMSCGGSLGEAGAGDPGSKWGSSSSTCSSSTFSSSTYPGETSKISGERSKGGSKVFVEGTRDSSRQISKTEKVVREERK